MGDISEMRGLVILATFLGSLILLIAWIPSGFYTGSVSGHGVEIPEYFEATSLQNFNYTYQITISDPFYREEWGRSQFGHDMCFWGYYSPASKWISNEHGELFLGFWFHGHTQNWISKRTGINRGGILYLANMEEDENSTTHVCEYTLKCEHFYMGAFIGYDTGIYTSIDDAWNNNDLHVAFGINWDQRGTSWDAWSMVAGILFFNLPEVNPYINALIAIPLWICIAYLVFIFVLRTIGAVFGGGGA